MSVAGRMPTAQRWRAQRAIAGRLDVIEKSLVDAVLSPVEPAGRIRGARIGPACLGDAHRSREHLVRAYVTPPA